MPTIAFDIDGTLAIGKHREHFITLTNGRTEKDWESYFAALGEDTLNCSVAEVCRALYTAGYSIIYLTARPAQYITNTRVWLTAHALPDGDIYHREEGDFRDDSILKLELLEEAKADGHEVIMIFDDRNRVVVAARGAGYTVAQIAPGDF
jgi:phosphoglycolate phosphatase-like HAD superfamily hydrolase